MEMTTVTQSTFLFVCLTDVWGGIEKNVAIRIRELARRGHDVHLIMLAGTFEEQFSVHPGVTLWRLPRRYSNLNPALYLHFVRIIRAVRPTGMFAALKDDWWISSVCAAALGIPNRLLYLGIQRKIRNNLKYRMIFRWFQARLITNSTEVKNAVIKSNRWLTEENSTVIYNGFDADQDQSPGSGLDWRRRLGLPDDAWVIGCAGRLSRQKGFDLIPDLLARLPANTHVLLAGEGAEASALDAQFQSCGVADRVHRLGHLDDMKPFYESLQCFVLLSRNEGMANVLNEALCYGLPIVSTRVPGSAELLGDGDFGLLANVEDVAAVASQVGRIMDGDWQCDPAKQRERIAKHFSLPLMVRRLEAEMTHQAPARPQTVTPL